MAKDADKQVKEPVAQHLTYGELVSRANYIIEVKKNGQLCFIQPFGRTKAIREQLEINPNDAIYLSFIK